MIPVLFARRDSVYKTIPNTDVYDEDRDALTWLGGSAAVYHPPCRGWGRLRQFAKLQPGELDLAIWSVDLARKYGGVLEHPAGSTLWRAAQLPAPGQTDQFGGITIGISQRWFGHKAEKLTLLYICGLTADQIPAIPFSLSYPTHVVSTSLATGRQLPEITKSEREHTPPALAFWLLHLATLISINYDRNQHEN